MEINPQHSQGSFPQIEDLLDDSESVVVTTVTQAPLDGQQTLKPNVPLSEINPNTNDVTVDMALKASSAPTPTSFPSDSADLVDENMNTTSKSLLAPLVYRSPDHAKVLKRQASQSSLNSSPIKKQ